MATILVSTGHSLTVVKSPLPDTLRNYDPAEYSATYSVHNWTAEGVVFFYVARHIESKQLHVWYRRTGSMWVSYGKTFKEAIEGAIRDGWQYA